MKVTKAKNGLTIIYKKRDTKTTALQVTVNTGSIFENDKQRGISHFIEHMLFEGTKTRDSYTISREVESLGAEFGAFTSNSRTCYYTLSINKNFDKCLEIVHDILTNPLFDEKIVDKERKIILNEIRLREDEPRFFQWQVFTQTLFQKHPVKYPIIGFRDTVNKIKSKDLFEYFHKQYAPNNLVISIVGNIPDPTKKIISLFDSKAKAKKKKIFSMEKPGKKINVKKIKRNIQQSYQIIGYKTVSRLHKDSYTLDVIRAILAKGLSGKLFREIRTKHGLAYDVGANHEAGRDYGFFAAYVNTQKKNLDKSKNIILKVLGDVGNTSQKEIDEAKQNVEGHFLIENEDNQKLADNLGFWHLVKEAKNINIYLKNIRKVTKKDIERVSKKYFSQPHSKVIISS